MCVVGVCWMGQMEYEDVLPWTEFAVRLPQYMMYRLPEGLEVVLTDAQRVATRSFRPVHFSSSAVLLFLLLFPAHFSPPNLGLLRSFQVGGEHRYTFSMNFIPLVRRKEKRGGGKGGSKSFDTLAYLSCFQIQTSAFGLYKRGGWWPGFWWELLPLFVHICA